jgi:hypothetical protein
MRIKMALTLCACLGALVVTVPQSASSAALVGHIAKTQDVSDGLVEKVKHRKYGRHYRYRSYHPYYGYDRPYYYRPYPYYYRPYYYGRPRFGIFF